MSDLYPSHYARKIASEAVLTASAKVARRQRELERQEASAISVFVLKLGDEKP